MTKNNGIEADTDYLVPLVTNRERFPNAPEYLPKYILLNNNRILVLKRKMKVVKFKNPTEPLTALLLCEPWRSFEDLDVFENDPELIKNAFLRRKEVLPYSVANYPELES